MDENLRTLQALRRDYEGSNKLYESLVAQAQYPAGVAGKAQYLTDLQTPVTYAAVPPNSPPGTQPTPQFTPQQLFFINSYQPRFEGNRSAGFGMRAAGLAGVTAALLYAWTAFVPPIKGIETHITAQERHLDTHYERQNEKHRRVFGYDAPWYKNKPAREELDQQASDGRESARGAASGLSNLAALVMGGALLFGLMKKKR